jgi:hypothetical protein
MPLMPNQMSGGAQSTGDQAKALFEDGLSQMAYGVLLNKLPNIAPDVATFKVLQCDPEDGKGVGAFVIVRQGQTFYIPVIMAESQIKPLDILYYKDLNVFLPLTKEWLEELDKLALGEMGQGVKAPESLTSDVDIRGTVIPPNTGRYSYASDASIDSMFLAARDHNTAPEKVAFLDFLQKAPENVKIATAQLFKQNADLNVLAIRTYGKTALASALMVTQKTASAVSRPELIIVDATTKTAELKDAFGSAAAEAYQGVKLKGYAAKDTRKNLSAAIVTPKEQSFVDFQEPDDAGAYRVWTTDGKSMLALISGKPVDLFSGGGVGTKIPPRNVRVPNFENTAAQHVRNPNFYDRYVGVTENGKLIDNQVVLAQAVPISELEGSAAYKKLMGDGEAGVRKGAVGIFITRRGTSFIVTVPVRIESITTSNGAKRITVDKPNGFGYDKRTLVLDTDGPRGKFLVSDKASVSYLPADAKFIATSGAIDSEDLITRQKDVEKWLNRGLVDAGGEKISVDYSDSDDCYFVGREAVYGFVPALKKLASEANIAVPVAEALLKQAREGQLTFWSVSPATVAQKIAQVWAKLSAVQAKLGTTPEVSSSFETKMTPKKKTDPTMPNAKTAGDESGSKKKKDSGGGGDPAQQAMDDVAMQQAMAQQAAQPSPVDLAVAEQMQVLQMQSQALQQQMAMLQTVQQRAQMIAGGGAMSAPMGATAMAGAPMDPSMMGAGAPVPAMGGQPQQGATPMPGQAQQGAVPMQGQPMMDPNAAQQGAMDPSMMGGQQGMDPMAAQQQQPMTPQDQGMAHMSGEDDSPETLMQQVNPEFLNAAGGLHDAGIFDAATLSSMAQSPALKDMVGAYLPNLEKSLDNVGRVLLTLWMDEGKIKSDIGNETFVSLEDNLRMVFKNLGDLILKMNQNSMVMRGPNDPSYKE